VNPDSPLKQAEVFSSPEVFYSIAGRGVEFPQKTFIDSGL